MKIDRHNYEEFFLLYIDNELSVDDKKQVEAFVLANPDLEEELIMLKQSQLVADDSIVFEGKENLMREGSAINMSNYEEWLLLYTDNELTTEQKAQVEKFTAAHPHVKEELDLFLQTKLEPVEIIFPNKESLYRREEKVRVISMTWLRVAVAAILILALGIGTYSIINRNNKTSIDLAKGVNTPAVKPNQPGEKINNTVTPAQNQTAEIKNDEVRNDKNETASVKQDQKKIDKKNNNSLPQQNLVSNNAVAANNNQLQNTGKSNETANITETSSYNKTNVVSSLALNTMNVTAPQQTINKPAVTKTLDESLNYTKASDLTNVSEPVANNDNEENKKLRGFFRKATRFIERTTKMNPANDDDKVLIGSMAVSLK